MDALDSLAAELNSSELPMFAKTTSQVVNTSSKDNSSVSELTQSILQDPTLTSKVLKLANSSFYNRNPGRINTISRAVMQLGFEKVRSICVSAILIENIAKAKVKERVIKEVVTSIHAAIQARNFADSRNDSSIEEVYISALLFRIGYMAFWCFGGDLADKLDCKLQDNDSTAIEEEILGFKLNQLSAKLVQDWKLSNLLENTFKGDPKLDQRIYNILIGHKLVQALPKGLDSPEVEKIIKILSKFTKMKIDDLKQLIRNNAYEAAKIAHEYGLGQYTDLILDVEGEETEQEVEGFHEPDPMVQMDILREISTLLKDNKLDLNMLFSMLLEGISRGVGMDRVLLALLTPDRKKIRGKYGLGWDKDKIERFEVGFSVRSVFTHVLNEKKPLWITERQYLSLFTQEVRARLKTTTMFMLPLFIRETPIAVICADRSISGRDLDDPSFTSFSFFGQLSNATLNSLYSK